MSDQEVSDVVEFLKNQVLGNIYAEDIEEKIKSIGSSSDKSGNYIHAWTLCGDDQMDACGSGQLGQTADGLFHFPRTESGGVGYRQNAPHAHCRGHRFR